MTESEVLERAFAMPLMSPAFRERNMQRTVLCCTLFGILVQPALAQGAAPMRPAKMTCEEEAR
jgi:hypothetical protein